MPRRDELLFATPSSVQRRVEQLELITERHVTWFAGDENTLVPVEVLAKGPLASFSIVDECSCGSPSRLLW